VIHPHDTTRAERRASLRSADKLRLRSERRCRGTPTVRCCA